MCYSQTLGTVQIIIPLSQLSQSSDGQKGQKDFGRHSAGSHQDTQKIRTISLLLRTLRIFNLLIRFFQIFDVSLQFGIAFISIIFRLFGRGLKLLYL